MARRGGARRGNISRKTNNMKTPFTRHEQYGLFYIHCDGAPFMTLPAGSTENEAINLEARLKQAYEMGYDDYASFAGSEPND